MRLTGQEDLRVQKTIEGIRSSFEDLLCEKDIQDITVKELCERARINKKTFYRYYPTLNDLLVELQDELFEDYMQQTEGLQIPEDLEQITREFLSFTVNQGKALERITCAPSYREVSNSMKERVLRSRPSIVDDAEEIDIDERRILIAFITESTLAIYRQWVAAGKPIPPERLTDMAVALVCGGAERLASMDA